MYINYCISIYYFTCFSRRTAQAMDFVYQATRQRDDFFRGNPWETPTMIYPWGFHHCSDGWIRWITWHRLTLIDHYWREKSIPLVRQFNFFFHINIASFSSEIQGTAQFSLVKRASFCAFVCRFPDLVVPKRPCATCLLRRAAQRLRRVASRVGGFGAAGAEGAAGPARERSGNGWILPINKGT